MNKELEEAIRTLKTMKDNIDKKYLKTRNSVAIETVLKYIENSIPKEKVLAKIQELNKIAKKKDIIPETVKEEKIDGSYVYSQRFNADGYIAEVIVNILKDLLEEKWK